MKGQPRMYGLFEKVDGRWVRVPDTGAYRKPSAVRIFQGRLLDGFFAGRHMGLRPVKVEAQAE